MKRLVLLGASNVARSIDLIVRSAQRLLGGPLDIRLAMGHGRSYGDESMLLGRRLPGILPCGLWNDLQPRPASETYALVTDVGNDVMYEVPVPQIVAWVEECLRRLADAGAKIVVTRLPLESLNIPRRRYLALRTLFYPRCGLPREEALRRARELDEALCAAARRYGACVAPVRPAWYGIDAVHIGIRPAAAAWMEILSHWLDQPPPAQAVRRSLRCWWYLSSLVPQSRRVFSFEQRRHQPSGRLRDGSTVAVY
jgi:hypothetical protein